MDLFKELEQESGRETRVVFCMMGVDDFVKDPKQQRIARGYWKKIGKYIRGEWPKPACEWELLREGLV